ncbi:MAG: hypothetical protein IPK67_09945 [Planctomycetes bacterium]|nr:hypothetical protein [Planctomycetota bacterium]
MQPFSLQSLPFGLETDGSAWSWLQAALLGASAVALWVLVARLAALERRLDKLGPLTGADSAPGSGESPAARPALASADLRRTEQLLGELRDGTKRLEDALLRNLSQGLPGGSQRPAPTALSTPADLAALLAERVTHRLLALGYERIVVITPREQFASILQHGGDVLVEARRDGALCKGRASFRDGALIDVAMQSAYATFP